MTPFSSEYISVLCTFTRILFWILLRPTNEVRQTKYSMFVFAVFVEALDLCVGNAPHLNLLSNFIDFFFFDVIIQCELCSSTLVHVFLADFSVRFLLSFTRQD